MEFGSIPVTQAEGAILAHSLRAGKLAFKKGRLLSAGDVAALVEADVRSVTVARLDPGDIPEGEAAQGLAERLVAPGLSISGAFTGRVNLFATADGILTYPQERLDEFNLVDESVTLALLPPWSRVSRDRMIGTLKIIPFAIAPRVFEVCGRIADTAFVSVAPFAPKRVALIQTKTAGAKDSVLDKTRAVLDERLKALGGRIVAEQRTAHDYDAVAAGLEQALANAETAADLVLMIGASAIVDRRDILPAAIDRNGGRVLQFGMPVDPGNLLMLGEAAGRPVLGLPGCARSPQPNGVDWVLERLCAGLEVSPRDIQRMGAGGLLKDLSERPLPRAAATRDARIPRRRRRRIAAVVLAAGMSRRMGAANKMLAELGGAPLLRHVVSAARASNAAQILVVTGHEPGAVRNLLRDDPVTFAHNPDYAEGQSGSIATAVRELGNAVEIDGALFCLGDMPYVPAQALNRLIAAFDPDEGRAICIPTVDGKRGNPVLWGRQFFAELEALTGDIGGRGLIAAHENSVAEVAVEDAGILVDIDTPEALAQANRTAPGTA